MTTGDESDSGRHATEDRYLFVIFRSRLTLALATLPPGQRTDLAAECWLGPMRYRMVDQTLVCFYDWLRNAHRRVVGVRFWLESLERFRTPQRGALAHLYRFSYVAETHNGHALEVYFSSDRRIDESNSSDQDFMPQPVFADEHGEWAVALYATDLDEVEMGGVRAADTAWELASLTARSTIP